MMRSTHAQAKRNRRRRQDDGPAWFRPFCRAQHALTASIRLIGDTRRTVAASRRRAHRRPVRTSRNLHEASALLVDASTRLTRAAEELGEISKCVAREPEEALTVPCVLVPATERWLEVAVWLQQASADIVELQREVLIGLQTGLIVPERPAEGRPRIRIAPRPVPIREYLVRREPRVIDRIAPIIRRRRRTPRPAAVRVPKRSLRGRAPPLSPFSLL